MHPRKAVTGGHDTLFSDISKSIFRGNFLFQPFFLCVALAGCYQIDSATVATKPVMDVCYGIALARAGSAPAAGEVTGLQELTRRQAFNSADLFQISLGEVRPGMTEAAAICVKGYAPNSINTTTTASGVSRQLVYGNEFIPANYIYTENGVVTAIQD